MEHATLDTLDKLIACWSTWDRDEEYLLTNLVPGIVDGSAKLTERERSAVSELRPLLSDEEWAELPILVAQRLDDKRREEREKEQTERERRQQELAQRQAKEENKVRERALVTRLEDLFETDFLYADEVFNANSGGQILSREEYEKRKTRFVQEWASRELGQTLDAEQAAAVAALGSDIQVIARAGSGKTKTLVTRAIFLRKHCQIPSREILLLAFNKRAAEEMKVRLAQVLGDDLPHVMTFHALAYALVQPEEELILDDPSADQLGHSREVQESIDTLLKSDEYGNQVRDLMLAHFRDDWERIVHGGFQMTMEEFLDYRRSLPRESLRGEPVKSFGEKTIANALFEHSVDYKYERNYRWNGVNYRPDFTILTGSDRGVVIEYFGLQGDADYDEMSEEKRRFWAERDGWSFLEFTPRDLVRDGVDGFIRLLLQSIQEEGVSWERRTEEEIWQLISRRAIDGFTRAMKGFVGRCRGLNLSVGDLESMIARHTSCSTAERLFLEVGVHVYRDYLQRLAKSVKEDFDGLMWSSASLIRDGQTRFARDRGREHGDVAQLRFVMIDEFQDFSRKFSELVEAIRSASPTVQFFCVGDNWQAINGFAGSDLVYFDNFNQIFQGDTPQYIRTNYRSATSIVEVGNAVMRERGVKARPKRRDAGSAWVCKLDEFTPSAAEEVRHGGDETTPAVLRLTKYFLDRGLDVVVLSRTNSVPWYVIYDEATSGIADKLERFGEHIRSYLPEEDHERVTVSTTHKYKGLEHSAVIVLDAIKRSYPLIHPHWVFLRVFGDTIEKIEDEERRLFYVAATRAEESLALVTEARRETPYLHDIRQHAHIRVPAWDGFPPMPSLDEARLEIRVFDAHSIRDQLKKLGYRWNSSGKYWHKAVPEEGFSFEALVGQSWAQGEAKVEVYSETGTLLY